MQNKTESEPSKMSPDTVMLLLTIGNPIVIELSGIWLIRLGKQTKRPIFVSIGKIMCIAAPIALVAGIGALVMANLRY